MAVRRSVRAVRLDFNPPATRYERRKPFIQPSAVIDADRTAHLTSHRRVESGERRKSVQQGDDHETLSPDGRYM